MPSLQRRHPTEIPLSGLEEDHEEEEGYEVEDVLIPPSERLNPPQHRLTLRQIRPESAQMLHRVLHLRALSLQVDLGFG